MKKLLLTFLTLLFCSLAFANGDIYKYPITDKNLDQFTATQQQLAKLQTVQGDFIQTQQIAALSIPLTTTGSFLLSKKSGLNWEQKQPFSAKITLTQDKLVQQMGNSQPVVITKQEQPLLFNVTQVVMNIFNGRVEELHEYFHVYFLGNQQDWQMALVPKSENMAKAISSIELQGGAYIRQVEIKEANNNQMTIQFNHVKVSSA